MRRLGILFPGQGSQFVGMGRALVDRYAEAGRVFDTASQVLGLDFRKILFEDPEGQLGQTEFSQLAVFVHSLAAWAVLKDRLEGVAEVVALAGHSLGEYTALQVAGAIAPAAALGLVRLRGQVMRDVGQTAPGGMMALLGLDIAAIEGLCRRVRDEGQGIVELANDNCPGQAVVGGEAKALKALASICEKETLCRTVKLRVSVACHTALMRPALADFLPALEKLTLAPPAIPVVGNVTGGWLGTPDQVRDELARQLTSPVRWQDCMRRLLDCRVDALVEVGPGNVLAKLAGKIHEKIPSYCVGDDPGQLGALLSALSSPNSSAAS